MAKLFISYRRDDSADICGRLDDKLAARFGRATVFKDVDSIPLGADFRQILRDAVGQCAAMLVVIGRQWVGVKDARGRRRLEDPNDFVRIEVEEALARKIPVIPVLVQGTAMPREGELPASLAPLAFRQSVEVRGDPHFHRDADQLLEQLAPLLGSPPKAPTSRSVAFMPKRLADLGFEAHNERSVEYITPPLCAVPEGPFLMGSNKGRDAKAYDNELPQHTVTLTAYQIARYPVTVAEYACFVQSGRTPPKNWQQQLAKLDHAVEQVSWHDAVAYAAWLAEATGQPWRLPSEAEWEKAARGADGRIYLWGDQWDKTRALAGKVFSGAAPVGGYPTGASPYGVLDLAGNVWEWTSNLLSPYPYSQNDLHENQQSIANRVLRGGSWFDPPQDARAASRGPGDPVGLRDYVGFRLLAAGDS